MLLQPFDNEMEKIVPSIIHNVEKNVEDYRKCRIEKRINLFSILDKNSDISILIKLLT